MGGRSLALGAVVAAVGASAAVAVADSDTVHVTVRPAVGAPHTHFRVGFRVPDSTGPSGSTVRSYEVSAAGPAGPDCASSASASVGSAQAGERVHATLTPGSEASWCAGAFSGRVEETITPVCGYRQLCPAYIATRTIGRFTFRVGSGVADRG